jgi:hypothetical protein
MLLNVSGKEKSEEDSPVSKKCDYDGICDTIVDKVDFSDSD